MVNCVGLSFGKAVALRCGWVGCVAFSCGVLWQFRNVGVSLGHVRSGPLSCGR